MREIGTLLIAFAPLDLAVSGSQLGESWPILVAFMVAGFSVLTLGIYLEWRVR